MASDPPVTVAVVGICGAAHLERCLAGLARQVGAPAFDIVVVHDPEISGLEELAARWTHVRLLSNAGQRTPLELAARALAAAHGDLILLTEDHCTPEPDWVATTIAAHAPGRGAVGGVVEIRDGASAVDWAFYFVDFFRYASPAKGGPAPTLTVCNSSYSRGALNAVADLWRGEFHETAVHDALRERCGELWLEPRSRVTMARHVELADALYERYAFGRLFGCTRLSYCSGPRRVAYSLFAPALPVLLLGRMARKAISAPRLARGFVRALVPLAAMVFWWSWGEWLGYLTRRLPRTLTVAPEIRAARRSEARIRRSGHR